MSLFADMEAQPSFGFPQPLAEKYRPRKIADFIGLEKQRKVLSAFARNPVSCAWLFLGPSGLGKSTMALALAEEMAAELHKIPSQKCNAGAIEETVRMCWYATNKVGGFHIVLADEADQMSNAAQLQLLSKLDGVDPAPQTIWIFTANDTSRLEKRFLSRCRVLEFSSYGMRAELAGLLSNVWKQEVGEAQSPDFERMAKDSTNNVHDALNTLEVDLLAV